MPYRSAQTWDGVAPSHTIWDPNRVSLGEVGTWLGTRRGVAHLPIPTAISNQPPTLLGHWSTSRPTGCRLRIGQPIRNKWLHTTCWSTSHDIIYYQRLQYERISFDFSLILMEGRGRRYVCDVMDGEERKGTHECVRPRLSSGDAKIHL